MKTLIIYYSLDGNTKFLAESMAQVVGADVFEIKTVKDLGKGFMKYIWGGKQVMMKEKPAILPFDRNLSDYEMIIIGSPVWASTFAPPLSTFLEGNKVSSKKVALFCSFAGDAGKTFENFKSALKDNQIVGEIGLMNPLKNREDSTKKVQDWINNIIKK